MGLQQVEHAQAFRGITVGEIKARQGQARGAGFLPFGARHRLGELAFGGQKTAAACLAPLGEIHIGGTVAGTRQGRGRLRHRHLRRGQRQARRTRDRNARGIDSDLQVVGIRGDHQAAGGRQGGEVGEAAHLGHAASRLGGNDGQKIAAGRIHQLEGMIGGGKQGGKRSALGIGLIAGKADHHRGRGDAGSDLHLQIGAKPACRDLGGSLQGDPQNAQTIAGNRFNAGGEIAQGGLEIAGVKVGRVFQHHPGGEAAHEHRAGAAARALEGDHHAVARALAVGDRNVFDRRFGMRRLSCGGRRLVFRDLGFGFGFGLCFRLYLGGFGLAFVRVPGQLGSGLRDGLRLGAARALGDLGDGRLAEAGRRIGCGVRLGRQNVDGDMAAVLEIVITGIGIGLEFHHRGVAVDAPGRILHPGRREARQGRNIDPRRCAEPHRHFSSAGIDLIGNILGPVEHQAGVLFVGAGAQLDLRQAGDIHRLGDRLGRRNQVRHRAGEIGIGNVHHGAFADLADMQLDRLREGEAQGFAVGIGAATGDEARHRAGDGGGRKRGLGVEGDGQYAAGGGGADLGCGVEGKAAVTVLHRAAHTVGGPSRRADTKGQGDDQAGNGADRRQETAPSDFIVAGRC